MHVLFCKTFSDLRMFPLWLNHIQKFKTIWLFLMFQHMLGRPSESGSNNWNTSRIFYYIQYIYFCWITFIVRIFSWAQLHSIISYNGLNNLFVFNCFDWCVGWENRSYGWGKIITIIIFKKIPRYYIFFGTKFSKSIKNKM